jgi:hypothetical protein
MNRHDATRRPDRFELEAAARQHRAEAWASAFEAAARWMSSHFGATKPHDAAVLSGLTRRAVN